jgi:hypothetical protein
VLLAIEKSRRRFVDDSQVDHGPAILPTCSVSLAVGTRALGNDTVHTLSDQLLVPGRIEHPSKVVEKGEKCSTASTPMPSAGSISWPPADSIASGQPGLRPGGTRDADQG